MSDKQDNGRYKRYFDILGLPQDAKPEEIRAAYLARKKTDSVESPDEKGVQDKDRPFVIGEIEEAWRVLSEAYGNDGPEVSETEEKIVRIVKAGKTADTKTTEKNIVFTGQILREIREKLNIEFDDITRETKISPRMIIAIENENYDALPPEVYVRGFLKGYAAFLSLDVGKVVTDYMARYGSWKKGSDKNRMHFRFSRKKGAFSIQAK